jgi:hypothetical protein
MNQILLTCRICEDQRYLGLYWKWNQLDLTERTILEVRALKGQRVDLHRQYF